eukprot:3497391-Rhodomonas_salina.3
MMVDDDGKMLDVQLPVVPTTLRALDEPAGHRLEEEHEEGRPSTLDCRDALGIHGADCQLCAGHRLWIRRETFWPTTQAIRTLQSNRAPSSCPAALTQSSKTTSEPACPASGRPDLNSLRRSFRKFQQSGGSCLRAFWARVHAHTLPLLSRACLTHSRLAPV